MEETQTPKTDPRHLSRILATQFVFAHQATKNNSDISASILPFEPNAVVHELEEKKYNTKLYEALVEGAIKFLEEIDNIIQTVAPAWPLDQINPVDLAILRIAIYEGFIERRNPDKVVINEAIELAKEMGSKENGSFVNGVLGTILERKDLKTQLRNVYEQK